MKRLIYILSLVFLLTSCSQGKKLQVQMQGGAVPLLEHSQITTQDFTVFCKRGQTKEYITDFAVDCKLAENIDSVVLAVGDEKLTVPVTLHQAEGYSASYSQPVYDSTVIDRSQRTIQVRFAENSIKDIPLSEFEDVHILEDENSFNIAFLDSFGQHNVRLEKTGVEKILCSDYVCPMEQANQQELSFYAVYDDGHTGPLKDEYVYVHTAKHLVSGDSTITVKYRRKDYTVAVHVAGEEVHPIKLENASGKRTLQNTQKKVSGVCFIGDSRLCGLKSSVDSDAFFIYRTAASLYWLKGEAVQRFSKISDDTNTIIILMGLNDIYHPEAYREYINRFAEEYSDKRVIYLSLGPVDEDTERKHGYSVKNSEIEEFNQVVKENLDDSVEFMDIYSYLSEEGFSSTDGVHYLKDDYIRIYNYVVERL